MWDRNSIIFTLSSRENVPAPRITWAINMRSKYVFLAMAFIYFLYRIYEGEFILRSQLGSNQ